MTRFIYFCIAVVILSFVLIPVYTGVSKEHDKIIQTPANDTPTTDQGLSFDEIYALADQSEVRFNPNQLNNITPAAGISSSQDEFSSGFGLTEDPALEDTENSTQKPEYVIEIGSTPIHFE